MSAGVVVVAGESLDAAAAHEAASFQQGMTAQQQRDLERAVEQSTREQVQQAMKADQAAARSGHTAQLTQTPGMPQLPPLPPIPAVPATPVTGVVVAPNGERIIVRANDRPVVTMTGTGDDQQVHVYAPAIPTTYIVLILSLFLTLMVVAVGMPLARAYARRMDRQGGRAGPGAFPTDVSDRIERIEQAVEAIAIEVERVSEGQRFTTKLLSEIRTPALEATPGQYAGEKR